MRTSVRMALLAAALLPAIGLLVWSASAEGPRPLPRPATGGTRGPSALVFSADGRLAFVAEQDTGQVAVLEADSGKLSARIPGGGKEPTGLALSADGRTLAVANSFSGTLGILDVPARTLRATVPLPG